MGYVWPGASLGFVADPKAIDDLGNQVESLTAPGWIPYTPIWAASGTQPNKGASGTLAGRWRRSNSSDIITVEVRLIADGTTTFGTGFYTWSLPVNASADAILFSSGRGNIYDSSALTRYGVSAMIDAANAVILNGHNGTIAQTVPFTWASGDQMRFTIDYQPVS
jgi:hypothetical protein